MKRVIAGFLALVLLCTNVTLVTFAAPTTKQGISAIEVSSSKSEGMGKVSASINFNFAERRDFIKNKNIKIQLLDLDNHEVASMELDGEIEKKQEFDLNGKKIEGSIQALNELGTQIVTEDLIHYYKVEFSNLPNNQSYKIGLSGNGYKRFQSDEIVLEHYSKELVIHTGSADFTMGDLNQDGEVTEKDLEAVEEGLSTYHKNADLDGGGEVDITDIALVNHNRGALGNAQLFDTEAIASAVANMDDLPEEVKVEGGSPEDILKQDTAPVKFRVEEGQSLSIPVTFTEKIDMEQIKISSPAASGAIEEGFALVEYEDEQGITKTEEISFSNAVPEGVHVIGETEGRSTVVINLGKRVAVKKVTITVTKVTDQEGNATFTVIEEIKFLKDIVPENPGNEGAIPQNFVGTPGNEQVSLKWAKVDNVTGYVVKYGQKPGSYTKQMSVEDIDHPIQIKGLDNLVPYYFIVYAVNGDWKGPTSPEIKVIPEPGSPPSAPDNLKVTTLNRALQLGWTKSKNAVSYSVYYKLASESNDKYVKAVSDLTSTGYVIEKLKNNVEYSVYVTAVNQKGESKPSLISNGIPMGTEQVDIPTRNRIDRSEIKTSAVRDLKNCIAEDQKDTFKEEFMIDGNYDTYFTASKNYPSGNYFEFTFKNPKTMDHLVYVPRLDGNYKSAITEYSITVKLNSSSSSETIALFLKPQNDVAKDGYAIMTFPKREKITSITVFIPKRTTVAPISLSEIAFYDYEDVGGLVAQLFKDGSYTQLAEGVTPEKIKEIEDKLLDDSAFYVDKKIMLEELAIAKGLLNQDNSVLGKEIDKVESRDTNGDIKVISTLQPMGIAVNAQTEIVIYASLQKNQTVKVIPSQFAGEVAGWRGDPIILKNGRNVIKFKDIVTTNTEKGGSLYLQYTGANADQIKLQVRGAKTDIPLLELSDWDQMSENDRRSEIAEYIQNLESYVPKVQKENSKYSMDKRIRNSTEIALPYVLLSLAADKVLAGVSQTAVSMEDKVNKLYDNILAWDDITTIMYNTYGIDDKRTEASRFNVRYHTMFAGAFMYAAGDHIGIGYGSVSSVVQGKPVSATGQGNTNSLFGWGVAHEMGHQLDTFGKTEITNNIYSLFAQTYDGGDNALTSRMEGSYERIFQKPAVSSVGEANDGFVSLTMYWQLHLAYDVNGSDNIYNKINKEYRNGTGAGLSRDDKFAVAASKAAEKNLTEFFTRWGFVLSNDAKAQMGAYEEETRAIYYYSDDSRRAILMGVQPVTGSISAEAVLNDKTATITINGLPEENVQGYEISRNDKVVGFSATPSYEDKIGSMNNVEIVYTVKAYDILGNMIAEAKAEPMKISHDNVVPREKWESAVQEDGNVLITMKDSDISIAGIKVTGKEIPGSDETFKKSDKQEEFVPVKIAVSDDGINYEEIKTFTESLVQPEDKVYLFEKEDGRIDIYNHKYIRISGLPTELSMEAINLVQYPGDDIEIDHNAIGYLKEDFRYGEDTEDVIKKGTLIVTGTYRGDPVYDMVELYGRFQTDSTEGAINGDESAKVERPMNGYSLLFAEVPEEGDMTYINNGFWIFVPDIQKEGAVTGNGNICVQSVLPFDIKVKLFRTDDPLKPDSKRLVGESLWMLSPTESTMPYIELAGGTNESK